ncbi:MAG: hypothetical protein U1A22_15440 [Xanthomonadaceae bacterium]|nr:hypothetical protein [Xanthomonadaceae bacterium]
MPPATRSRIRGVTLIELLVGTAVGIIVVSALVAFIVSSVQANSENLRSIRLTQELRALTELIGREIRRARHVSAPDLLAAVGATPLPPEVTQFSGVRVLNNGSTDCIEFAYFIPDDGDANSDPRPGRRIWLDGATNRINVARYPAANIPGALTGYCTGGAPGTVQPISSPEIRITRLEFDGSDAGCFATDNTNNTCAGINLLIEARIGAGANEIVRSFGQRIRIRSSANPPPVATP